MSGLSVRQVHYSYGPKQALDDVSFEVGPGTFCALLGPNGAGKSTLFSLLTRLLVTSQGDIEVAGWDIRSNPRQALANLGVVFQQPTLDLDLTVWRNLTYFAALHGLSGRAAERRIEAALDRLNMRERTAEKVRALNGGHRRRLEIARCLIHEPPVLLLDEATVGLDTAARRAITAHLHDLSAGSGLTVLWATHLTDEIEDDDQVVILDKGRVVQTGTCRDIRGETDLQTVFLEQTETPQ